LAAVIVRLLPERDAAKMRAHANDNQPFGHGFAIERRLFHSRRIGLRVAQRGDVDVLRRLDLLGGAAVDKDRFAAPGDRQTLADLNWRQIDSASVSLAGLRLSMNGQIAQAAPTTPSAVAVRVRKSRRVSPS
jgi:hypothetical protein